MSDVYTRDFADRHGSPEFTYNMAYANPAVIGDIINIIYAVKILCIDQEFVLQSE